MAGYFHSVTLDESLCKGCTNCIKRCPTEAIRVRGGKAHIIQERCIDCGECIRTCAQHAKSAVTDSLDRLSEFDYRIALVPPAFFGLWRPDGESWSALSALLKLGFDQVFEVAVAADVVARACRLLLDSPDLIRPAISSACPAVVRLMQVRYPTLLPHLIPLEAPVEIAAHMAKQQAMRRTNLNKERIGAFFITPCPAKVTAIKQPVGREGSDLDGAFSAAMIYGAIVRLSGELLSTEKASLLATAAGIEWGYAGGEALSISGTSSLAVDGIHSVISVLDEVERGRLSDIDFIEAQACIGGCMGGCLMVYNPYIGKLRLQLAAKAFGSKQPVVSPDDVRALYKSGVLSFCTPIEPRPVMKLDPDLGRALEMMRSMEQTLATLPGLDCGACGSPSCRALAEDIARGNALATDCIFLLRERVRELAEEMVDLARKVPPAMGQNVQSVRKGAGGVDNDGR